MTIVFRTKEWLSLPQLVGAWGSELEVGEEPNRSQKALEHVLLEDIINGRLDHTGPLQDGRKRGLHLEFGGRAYFVEGHEIRTLMASDPWFSLHRIVIMKGAILDFAKRREIPPPSWWTDGTSVSTDAGVTTTGTHSIAASPIPAPTHSARPRGRTPKKLDQVKEAMREDIRLGQKTPDGLRDMIEKDLAAAYGVSRDTARRARDAVLSECREGRKAGVKAELAAHEQAILSGNSIPDISNKNDK